VSTVTLEEAQAQLPQLIERLQPGEEIVITRDQKPVATVRAMPPTSPEAPRLGTLKGTILHIAPDFDAIPEGFEDYLP
jgi:antitoxin (DNA-binding transcriptional repressor) of toxin-antitoxin stability system